MDYAFLMTVLRLIHITTGAFWAGAACYLAWFVLPAVQAIGPAGAPFMQQLPRTRRLPQVMTFLSTLTILSGLWLYYISTSSLEAAFFSSRHATLMTIGGILGIISYCIATFFNLPTAKKLGKLGAQIAASGQAPSPEQAQQLMALRNRMMKATNVLAIVITSTVVMMAIMRYL